MLLVHQARTHAGGTFEPVGVWRLGDHDESERYYPPRFGAFEARGEKALFGRLPGVALQAWGEYKAHTSPNWRIFMPKPKLFAPASEVIEPAGELKSVFEEVRAEYEAPQVPLAQGRSPKVAPADASLPGASFDWRVVQSWRIAAALTRRHPELIAYEMHPGGGQYDVLCITAPDQLSPSPGPKRARVMINRAGSIHVESESRLPAPDWPALEDADGIRCAIESLEAATGWIPPMETPAATARTLAYRFIAASLELLLLDGLGWDARCEFFDSSGGDPARAGHLVHFPTAVEESRTVPSMGIHGEPESHFWALLRGGEAVLVVSIEGRLHRRSGQPLDLMSLYAKQGRRIRRVAARVLDEWL